MNRRFYPVEMEIAGNTAMWARPDTGDGVTSYPVPTYSAVKGLFEAVLWGPDIVVIPRKVELCTPVQFHSYATNYTGPLRGAKQIKTGANYQMFATVLIDVCYRLYADVVVNPNKENQPPSARVWDQKTTSPGHAYQEIFNRRLKRGQSFGSLALGWREFTPSYFGPFRANTRVCDAQPDIHIPSMLRTVFSRSYKGEFHARYDTNLTVHRGVLEYPPGGDGARYD